MKTTIIKFLVSLPPLLPAAFPLIPENSAGAQNRMIVQGLQADSSNVRFSVSSNLVNASGRFQKPAGRLKLDPRTFEPRAVEIRLKGSNLVLDQGSGNSMLSSEALAASFPGAELQFVSTSINTLSNSEYLVKGQFKWGSQSGKLQLRAKRLRTGAARSKFMIAVAGPIDLPLLQLPFTLNGNPAPQPGRGKLDAELEFAKDEP